MRVYTHTGRLTMNITQTKDLLLCVIPLYKRFYLFSNKKLSITNGTPYTFSRINTSIFPEEITEYKYILRFPSLERLSEVKGMFSHIILV